MTYIALLRGINVGGKNMIKMADLKRMFEAIGYSRVQTYIQSGNVLFEANDEESLIRKHIEHEIEAVFGFSVAVILRTATELEWILSNCPFSEEEISKAEATAKGESLYVSLMAHAPSQEGMERLNLYKNESDKFKINGREVYLLFHHSIRNSKLANNLQKLDVPATVRNWKTLSKLAAMAKAIEP